MESNSIPRARTLRVEGISPGSTAEQLKELFHPEDRPGLQVRSIAPAVDDYGPEVRNCTATISYQRLDREEYLPRLLDENVTVDKDFHGFTPLNEPQEPIAAE